MRYLLLALLVVFPLALGGWMAWRGQQGEARDEEPQPTPSRPVTADPDAALRALFAGELGGLSLSGEVKLYDAQGLFEYIDGAAPVFIERHFRKLAAAELKTTEGSELVCDVYDMGDLAGAMAIFDKERSPAARAAEGWPESQVGNMSFVFRESRYYVKLTAFDAKAEAALPALARALRGKMR